jgi:hypothetical protein
MRVVLVGPTATCRSWNGGRIFHGMPARFERRALLTDDEVRDWLARLASAPRGGGQA